MLGSLYSKKEKRIVKGDTTSFHKNGEPNVTKQNNSVEKIEERKRICILI